MLPLQKPTLWNADPGIIEYNCRKHGMPVPVVAIPMWEGAGDQAVDLSGNGNHADIGDTIWDNGLVKNTSSLLDIPNSPSINSINNNNEYTVVLGLNRNIANTSYLAIGKPLRSSDAAEITFSLTISWSTPASGYAWRLHHAHSWTNKKLLDNVKSASTDKQIVGLYDGSYMRLYTNGVPTVSLATTTIPGTTSDNLTAGGHASTTYDYTYIYNRALSPYQVKFLNDDPYFMFRVPDELYGYAAAGVSIPVLIHQMQQQGIL